jgi:hypothetical protein
MYILPTDKNEVAHIGNTLKPNASTGKDSLSPKIIWVTEFLPKIICNIIEFIAPPMSNMFKLSLSTGSFPNKLKVAKVTPSLKQIIDNVFPITDLCQFYLSFQDFREDHV